MNLAGYIANAKKKIFQIDEIEQKSDRSILGGKISNAEFLKSRSRAA